MNAASRVSSQSGLGPGHAACVVSAEVFALFPSTGEVIGTAESLTYQTCDQASLMQARAGGSRAYRRSCAPHLRTRRPATPTARRRLRALLAWATRSRARCRCCCRRSRWRARRRVPWQAARCWVAWGLWAAARRPPRQCGPIQCPRFVWRVSVPARRPWDQARHPPRQCAPSSACKSIKKVSTYTDAGTLAKPPSVVKRFSSRRGVLLGSLRVMSPAAY